MNSNYCTNIGPLTYAYEGKTYVVGVVSWGYRCAYPGKAGVYARVTTVLPWIKQHLRQKCVDSWNDEFDRFENN